MKLILDLQAPECMVTVSRHNSHCLYDGISFYCTAGPNLPELILPKIANEYRAVVAQLAEQFLSSVTTLFLNKAQRLDVAIHIISFYQPKCIISKSSNYSTI